MIIQPMIIQPQKNHVVGGGLSFMCVCCIVLNCNMRVVLSGCLFGGVCGAGSFRWSVLF